MMDMLEMAAPSIYDDPLYKEEDDELMAAVECCLTDQLEAVMKAVPKGTIIIVKGDDITGCMEEPGTGLGGGALATAMLDSSYNSGTATYDGLPVTGLYNGGY